MAISAGDVTVGIAGDYSTWASALADIIMLTGDLTLTQISNITEVANAALSVGFAGFKLKLTSDTQHVGIFTAGWLITNNVANANLWSISSGSTVPGAVLEVTGLRFTKTAVASANYSNLSLLNPSNNTTYKINNIVIDLASALAVGIYAGGYNTLIHNCSIINGQKTTAGSAGSVGVYLASAGITLENITCYNIRTGILNQTNSICTISNCICFGNTIDYATTSNTPGLGNAIASKCASTDTSGTEAALQGLTAANEFVNVSPLTLGFLQLKPTSILNFMGVAPTIAGNTTGIRGNARPFQANVYSIGADEQGSTITKLKYTIGVGGDFSTCAAFSAALPSALVCDIVGEQISEVTEVSQVLPSSNLQGCRLTLTCKYPHEGIPSRGLIINCSLTTNYAFVFTTTSTVPGAVLEIKGLNLKATGTRVGNYVLMYVNYSDADVTTEMSDVIFNLNNLITSGVSWGGGTSIAPGRAKNLICINGVKTLTCYGLAQATNASYPVIWENCTVYNCHYGFWNYSNNAGMHARNIASFGCTRDYAYTSSGTAGLGPTSAFKCASSDTTGSEAVFRSLIAADQFVSLVDTSPDFLKLKAGSALLDSGVDPVIPYNINGVRGNSHLHGACYSIGADAWTDTSAGISTVGSGGDFATWNAFFASLGTLSKNVKGVQISDITLVSAAAYTGAKVGYNVSMDTNINPRGDFNVGWYTDIAFVGSVHGITLGGTSTIAFSKNIVTNIKARRTVGYAAGATVYAMFVFTSPLANNINIATGVLLNGNNLRGSGMGVSGAITYFSNCKVANIDRTSFNNGYGLSINVTTGNGSMIENCSAYNCKTGFWNYSNIAATYRNNAAFNCTVDYANGISQTAGIGTNTVASRCASSDATGSEASLRSLVAISQFKSLDITNANFLRVKNTGVLAGTGTTSLFPTVVNYPPTLLNTRGINGSRRPHMV